MYTVQQTLYCTSCNIFDQLVCTAQPAPALSGHPDHTAGGHIFPRLCNPLYDRSYIFLYFQSVCMAV
jgi:hypothetical protein